MLYISSDHRGFEAKDKIKSFLETAGVEHEDLGPHEYNPDDDYPDFAFSLGEKVAENEADRGILLCGSGVGICIAANKVRGVRAAYAESKEHAIKAREDDDTNVLVLDVMTFDPTRDFPLIEAWLHTPFSNEERHRRRVEKIKEYENS